MGAEIKALFAVLLNLPAFYLHWIFAIFSASSSTFFVKVSTASFGRSYSFANTNSQFFSSLTESSAVLISAFGLGIINHLSFVFFKIIFFEYYY